MEKESGFEWRADEEDALFKAGSTRSIQEARRRSRARFLLILLVVMGIAIGLGFLKRKQISLQENAKQEILAGYELWRQAVLNDDPELFGLTVSLEERQWQQTQKRLLSKRLILNRSEFGLHARHEGMTEPVVEMLPDMQQARLFYELPYYSETWEVGETISLRHTLFYKKYNSRWLQISPDDEYWGTWQIDENRYLSVKYRMRDQAVVSRIGRDLDDELSRRCDQISDSNNYGLNCSSIEPFTLVMSNDPAVLEEFMVMPTGLSRGKSISVPTPSLIGLPVDERGYEAIYRLYARKFVNQFDAYFNLPMPLPKESVNTICFDFPNEGPRLYRYEPLNDSWHNDLPDRTFFSLRGLPDDSGIVVREVIAGDENNRLRLTQFTGSVEKTIFDDLAPAQMIKPIGWAGSDSRPRLLLQSSDVNQSHITYSWVDLQYCAEDSCRLRELPGYSTWSPSGEHTLVIDGSSIHLGDKEGKIIRQVGQGFNPFWLQQESFGFIRFSERDSGMITEVVAGNVADEESFILLDSDYLAGVMGAEHSGRIFVQHVATIPAKPDTIIIAASGVRDLAGEYFIFSYQSQDKSHVNVGGRVHLLLHNKGALGGTPATLTPTGFSPLEVSPDGRWVLVSELNSNKRNTWTFIFIDLDHQLTKQLSESFPTLPAQFPFYDWSKDGRWLVIVDHGFFRLIAPEYDYERLVPHEFDSCGFTVWSQ
ncbi:MAG: hypothetical protein R3293_23470 [Candidatus Promineifilaceae bacterium]|nr:hypothetical protein [Candidatus Promineifilaceae bacterium]